MHGISIGQYIEQLVRNRIVTPTETRKITKAISEDFSWSADREDTKGITKTLPTSGGSLAPFGRSRPAPKPKK